MKNFHMIIGLFKNGLYARFPYNKAFYLQSNFKIQLGDQIQFGMSVSLSVRLDRSYFQTCRPKPIFVQYCMVLCEDFKFLVRSDVDCFFPNSGTKEVSGFHLYNQIGWSYPNYLKYWGQYSAGVHCGVDCCAC